MCSLSRYLLVGGLSGMAVATVSGSELVGWLAAAGVVGLMLAAQRLFPTRHAPSACALSVDTASAPTSSACAPSADAPSAGAPPARDEPASNTSRR